MLYAAHSQQQGRLVTILVRHDEILPPGFGVGGYSWPAVSLLAQKLITLRFIRKLSREDLARMSGVSVDTLKQAETLGSPIGLDEVEALAQGLGMSVAELLKPPGATAEERVVMALLGERVFSGVRADS